MKDRVLSELVNECEPAWPWVAEQLRQSAVEVQILPCERMHGEKALLDVQVTTKSPMGAILHGSAGILVDHGWLRFFGAGCHSRMQRSMPVWNSGKSDRFLLVADDVLGGQFAINGGRFDGAIGEVFYFAPESLEWEGTELGYSQFLCWALCEGSLSRFYEASRWEGWEAEADAISGDEAISVYPFLFTEGPPIGQRSRRAVPVVEQIELMGYLRAQIGGSERET